MNTFLSVASAALKGFVKRCCANGIHFNAAIPQRLLSTLYMKRDVHKSIKGDEKKSAFILTSTHTAGEAFVRLLSYTSDKAYWHIPR